MEWESIQIQSNCIETSTERAVLINMPKTSTYKGYSFWHPAKCCRSIGKNNYLLQISFTEDFRFRLRKYGKGQYNYKDVLGERELDSEELKNAFGFGINESLYQELSEE